MEHKYGVCSSARWTNLKKLRRPCDTILWTETAKRLEYNWVPTADKDVAPCICFYSAKKEVIDRSRVMPDIEEMKQ